LNIRCAGHGINWSTMDVGSIYHLCIINALPWWYLKGNVGDEIANQKAVEFLTGYVIEKSVSIDNIFVFLMIF
jgi:hypothetical protein